VGDIAPVRELKFDAEFEPEELKGRENMRELSGYGKA
jgi:hypothetical protein